MFTQSATSRRALTAAATLALASAACAAPMHNAYIVPASGDISVVFQGQDAGATGWFYFLGFGLGNDFSSATHTDSNELGAFLFSNKGTPVGSAVSIGYHEAGTALHFAYIITKGSGAAKTGDIMRTDDPATSINFLWGAPVASGDLLASSLGVEDIKNPAKSDWDFNDVTFDLIVDTSAVRYVPAPGPVTLMAFAGLMSLRRKDRTAR